jgi:hypothetical protein
MPKKAHAHAHPGPHAHPRPVRVRGTVVARNVSPKGHFEGIMIATIAGASQINFPKHEAEALARSLTVGSEIDVAVTLESDGFDHPVYVLAEQEGEGEARGTITRLNYALHGEVNGFHLDDGTFVHLNPEGAKKHDPRVGERVVVTGERRRGSASVVLEATSLQRTVSARATKRGVAVDGP